jgi:hypothetical protein
VKFTSGCNFCILFISVDSFYLIVSWPYRLTREAPRPEEQERNHDRPDDH